MDNERLFSDTASACGYNTVYTLPACTKRVEVVEIAKTEISNRNCYIENEIPSLFNCVCTANISKNSLRVPQRHSWFPNMKPT